jgi:acyl dehydratase
MATVFESPRDLLGKEGLKLDSSDWLTIDQARIDGFAAVTGDHQWIHVDPERARHGPFGRTIAHGYLTVSLIGMFLPQIIEVRGFKMALNVGVDKVRLVRPVRSGTRIRGVGEIKAVTEVRDGAIQAVILVTVEIENSDDPACIVETISRYFPE